MSVGCRIREAKLPVNHKVPLLGTIVPHTLRMCPAGCCLHVWGVFVVVVTECLRGQDTVAVLAALQPLMLELEADSAVMAHN